uniref:Autophagy protein 5 n=1 Tax=Syphacia muris TaxID=451379 RepID=A0A0N5ARF7_9BILA
MTRDYEVRRKLWDGKIPVQFILDLCESVNSSTKPYFVMLPRVSYFTLILPRVLQFFGTAVEHFDASSVWLQCGTTPLKWHYPVGVLYDLLKSDEKLPWTITVRVTDFPKELIRWSRDSMESSFIQSIKEADYLRHKAEVVNSMTPEEYRKLWNGLVNEKFDEYWFVNEKLVSEDQPPKNVPIRWYEVGHPFIEVLIAPFDDTGKQRTLSDACRIVGYDGEIVAISHGIELPLETPLLWMVENYSYLDNFVHIVIKKNETSKMSDDSNDDGNSREGELKLKS